MIDFKVMNIVFCDGFRMEAGGRYMLFGVSAPDVFVPTVPMGMVVAIWMDVLPSGAGNFDMDFRLVGQNEEEFMRGKLGGDIPIIGNPPIIGRTSFAIGPLPIQIKGPGAVRFEWKKAEYESWTVLGEITVRLQPTA